MDGVVDDEEDDELNCISSQLVVELDAEERTDLLDLVE